jgi:DNA-binding GntR family transcriptional regulator
MSLDSLPDLARPNISDEVYAVLKKRILSRQLALGERLDLSELEEQLGISRTPLKDALNRLALEGLVEIQPRRGTFVVNPTPDEIAESFDVRCVLEVYAAGPALQRVTESQLEQLRDLVKALRRLTEAENWGQIFQEYMPLDYSLHKLILEIAGNGRLLEIWEQVNVHAEMVRIRYGRSSEEAKLTQEEHEEILQAFEARDITALQQLLSHHIKRVKRSIIRDLQDRGVGD